MCADVCPAAAEEKIKYLLLSVNEKGNFIFWQHTSTSTLIAEKKQGHTSTEIKTDIVIAEGHKSRFNAKVMEHCEINLLDQFILPSDISGVTQKYDQIHQLLHETYENKKCEMYSE